MIRLTWFAIALSGLLSLPVPAVELTPYWRISVIAEQSADTRFRDSRCSPGDGRHLYFGCVTGEDDRALGARGSFGTSLGFDLALGVTPITAPWRSEIALIHQPDYRFSGNANFLNSGAEQPVRADLDHTRLEWRGFLELARLTDLPLGTFEPYLGAGLALSHNHLRTATYEFPELANQPAETLVPGGRTTNFGASVYAGTGWRFSELFTLDVGLSYGHHGKAASGRNDIRVIRGAELVAEVAVEPTEAQLRTLGLYVGLKQSFY